MCDFELTKGKETRVAWSTNVDCGTVVFVCEELGIVRSFNAYDNLIVFSAYETEQMAKGIYSFEIKSNENTKYNGKFEVREPEKNEKKENQDG